MFHEYSPDIKYGQLQVSANVSDRLSVFGRLSGCSSKDVVAFRSVTEFAQSFVDGWWCEQYDTRIVSEEIGMGGNCAGVRFESLK